MLALDAIPVLCGTQAGNEAVQFDMEGVDLGAEPDASTSGPAISTVGFGVQGPYMLPRYGAQRRRCRGRLQRA